MSLKNENFWGKSKTLRETKKIRKIGYKILTENIFQRKVLENFQIVAIAFNEMNEFDIKITFTEQKIH